MLQWLPSVGDKRTAAHVDPKQWGGLRMPLGTEETQTGKEVGWSSARREGEGEGQLVSQLSVGKSYDTDVEEKQK